MFRSIAINIALVFAGLLASEALLQLGSRFSSTVDFLTARPFHDRFLVNPVNGYYGNPDFPGHDEWGYRNAEAPRDIDLVAIGDSWTYGGEDAAWPPMLADLSGRRVYNMGIGGRGAINYLQAFRKIQPLKPRLVIVAVYFGNDLFVTDKHFNMDLAQEVFGGDLETHRLKVEEAKPFDYKYLQYCGPRESSDQPTPLSEFQGWFSRNSRLFGLLRELKNVLIRKAEADDRLCEFFSDGEWQTVLQSKLRAGVTDLTDVRVQAGLVAIKSVISIISSEADNLLVVLFPTKESAFQNRIDSPSKDLEMIFENEKTVRQELGQFLREQGIRYVDVLPFLQEAKQQSFKSDHDGHPNAYGYEVIARAVSKLIQ